MISRKQFGVLYLSKDMIVKTYESIQFTDESMIIRDFIRKFVQLSNKLNNREKISLGIISDFKKENDELTKKFFSINSDIIDPKIFLINLFAQRKVPYIITLKAQEIYSELNIGEIGYGSNINCWIVILDQDDYMFEGRVVSVGDKYKLGKHILVYKHQVEYHIKSKFLEKNIRRIIYFKNYDYSSS